MKKALAVVAAFAYLVMPIDLLPGIILGPIGVLDDLGVRACWRQPPPT